MNVTLTFFIDQFATTKNELVLDIATLARRIEATTARSKANLPWLKCARFGDRLSEKRSLRWDGNLLAVTGVEADYDGEQIQVDQALSRLRAAGLLAIAYTSPSHAPNAPRWRVLAPFSRDYPPEQRDRFLARLNGLFGGIFAPESWTLSQSYYFGSVGRNPSHRVALLDGTPIDRQDYLDALAIGKPEKPEAATRPSYPPSDPSKITDKRLEGLVKKLLSNISRAAKGAVHDTLLIQARTLGGYAHLLPYSDDELLGLLLNALPADPDPDPKTERQTALDGLQNGIRSPLHLEERPHPVQFAGRVRAA